MRTTSRLLIGALWCGLLIGCSSGDEFADIRAFIRELESRPKGSIRPLPAFEAYQAFTYGAANQRSPFEPPIVLPPKSAAEKRIVGIEPPKNHVKQYLEKFGYYDIFLVDNQGNVVYSVYKEVDFATNL